MELGLYESDELSNSKYHGARGFYSSSQFKDALDDIELFYKKYISGEVVGRESIPAFDIGTYFHTAILEPHNLENECAVFTGGVRRGKAWDEFKDKHEGKAIITAKELLQAENLITATKASPIAMGLLSQGESEFSCFTNVMGLPVKVRADWINIQEGYILDLKSTTGNAKDEHKTKNKISNYNYDLSASLYIDAFNAHYGEEIIKDFYWTFSSKDYSNSKTYRASREMLEVGRRKYQKALRTILKYMELNWEFVDELADVSPLPWEKDLWLEDKGPNKKKFDTAQVGVRQVTDRELL